MYPVSVEAAQIVLTLTIRPARVDVVRQRRQFAGMTARATIGKDFLPRPDLVLVQFAELSGLASANRCGPDAFKKNSAVLGVCRSVACQ